MTASHTPEGNPLNDWTSEELTQIAAADELELASRRADGTWRNPVTIWVVQHGEDLYVRSVNGPDAAWYRSTQASREGRIRVAGLSREVAFADAGPDLNSELDDAYRAKYRRYGAATTGRITSPAARSTTLRLVPQ
jgi:hypothetical protein